MPLMRWNKGDLRLREEEGRREGKGKHGRIREEGSEGEGGDKRKGRKERERKVETRQSP